MSNPVVTPQMAREADAACVYTNLSTLADAATTLFDRVLRPAGINVEQLGYLVCIHGLPGISVSDLAARKAKDLTSVRASLARMHFRGWVGLPDLDDAPLTLTREGQSKLDEGAAHWEGVQSEIVEAIGGGDAWSSMVGHMAELFAAIRRTQ